MAEGKTATETMVALEGNLPDVVASLEMLTVTSAARDTDTLLPKKMVLRKRIRKPENVEVRNRRCSLRPKKRTASEMESEDEVKEYYLDKHVRKRANNLETIFEEPDEELDDTDLPVTMSTKRFKRMIHFQSEPTDAKIKKRRAKVKRLFGTKFPTLRRQPSMQTLINKLNSIRSDSLIRITENTRQITQVFNPYDAVRRCGMNQ